MILNETAFQDMKAQLDTEIKRLLAQKIVLAWILRRNVREFAEMNLDAVMACIEGEPLVGCTAVNPGQTNPAKPQSSQITGMNTENVFPGEGALYYDIIFYVRIPGKRDVTKMIINVEAQNDFYPGYHIETRAVFYAAREISAQKCTEFEHSDYDSIKKVYSIWLCMNAPKYIGNAISEYTFYKNDFLPGFPDRKNAYDKIAIVMIALNESVSSPDKFIGMMNTLVSTKIGVNEKKRRLQEDYDITVTSELEKEMNKMCNFADTIEANAIKKGEMMGVKLGEQRGIKQSKHDIVQRMLRSGKYSIEEISDITELSVNTVKEIQTELMTLA